ncbi:MAG: divergent polysaccharide deacetylase family protein [Candidatus Dadabacteria bacterium]|nr:divergent polysaccharide deacetylase family protein [Candidatus Dadabacteria bacterium]
MPRKPRSYKKSRRPARRKRNARVSRIVLFTIGFILLVFFGLYGLNYLKQNVSSDFSNERLSATEMDNLIKEIDRSLAGAFFDAGISSKNIESKKVYNKGLEELMWEYKDMKIVPEKGITSQKVKKSLEDSILTKLPVKHEFKDGKNSLTVYFKINDVTTHKIQFVFNNQKPTLAKTKKGKPEQEKLKEKKIKTSDKSKTSISKKATLNKNYTKSKIVIIVDDLGQTKKPIDQLLKIPASITFAVLPNLPYSSYAAEEADKRGRDVILHMPMEPKESSGYTAADAGDSTLLVGLPKDVILSKLNKSLSSVPHVKGVNNHMGSKFMENRELTELILRDLKSKGLMFVDSKTSSESKGYETALKLGMKTAQRDIFLDNSSKNSQYVKDQLKKLVNISKKRGFAIGICHPYPGTVKALSEMIPEIKNEVEVVSISNIVNQSSKLGRN